MQNVINTKPSTGVDAGQGRGEAEVELDVFRQERGVAGYREGDAETDDEAHVDRIDEQSPTSTWQVCITRCVIA